MEEIIKAENVGKIYNHLCHNEKIALKNVDMTICKGSFVSIMGKSGSGKTTLINVLSTIDQPTSGNIYISGENILGLGESAKAKFRKEKLSFVFQDYNLIDSLTNRENMLLSIRLNNKNMRKDKEFIAEIVKKLEIEDILDKYPSECSGGQKQRIAIARALINQSEIIFCDEPTGNLDSIMSKRLMEYLKEINRVYGTTIIVVTHDCLVAAYSDEMYYVEDGEILHYLVKGEKKFESYYSDIARISMKLDL